VSGWLTILRHEHANIWAGTSIRGRSENSKRTEEDKRKRKMEREARWRIRKCR
jgi:hypothetical protein